MAGSSVGAASRWRSMPSKASTNLSRPDSRRCSPTTKALILSHLPLTPSVSSLSSWPFKSSLTLAIARSSRCRVVMHSWDRTIAHGFPMASKIDLTSVLFPVASTPWTMIVGGLGSFGYFDVNGRCAGDCCADSRVGERQAGEIGAL